MRKVEQPGLGKHVGEPSQAVRTHAEPHGSRGLVVMLLLFQPLEALILSSSSRDFYLYHVKDQELLIKNAQRQ